MIQIQKLSPSNLDAYLDFFDHRAFADNPEWASCYCNCYYVDRCTKPWSERSGAENRADVVARVNGPGMSGYLAMLDGVAVGWCSAAPMADVLAFDEDPPADRARVGVIVCFVVEPERRGQGLARMLLRAACDDLAAQGLEQVEAHPRLSADSDGRRYKGPHTLYISEGFEQVRLDGETAIMRKALRP